MSDDGDDAAAASAGLVQRFLTAGACVFVRSASAVPVERIRRRRPAAALSSFPLSNLCTCFDRQTRSTSTRSRCSRTPAAIGRCRTCALDGAPGAPRRGFRTFGPDLIRIRSRCLTTTRSAEDWDLARPLETCRLVVERRGDALVLEFLAVSACAGATADPPRLVCRSTVQAVQGRVPPGFLESVVDSSRYFAVRIQDGAGKEATIGFGFR